MLFSMPAKAYTLAGMHNQSSTLVADLITNDIEFWSSVAIQSISQTSEVVFPGSEEGRELTLPFSLKFLSLWLVESASDQPY